MENKLRNLYALQFIDSNLDELEELKGDLPGEIRELDQKQNALSAHRAELEQTMKSSFAQRDNADSEIISLQQKVEKYKGQQLHVRNNKEYDALTKEMDNAAETITRLEKEMTQLEAKATNARDEIETTAAQIEELEKLLAEKRAALAEVAKTTEAEETKFKHDRQKVAARITKADLATYERIRKAKKGKAVVSVKRGACGGCFNRVPPQKLLELRQNNKLYTCEHCGRIIVSTEIADSVTSEA